MELYPLLFLLIALFYMNSNRRSSESKDNTNNTNDDITVEEKPRSKLASFLMTSVLVIVGLFLVLTIAFFVDDVAFGDKYYNKITYGSDCEFVSPTSKYKLVYSEETKEYAIAVDGYKDYYLYTGRYGIEGMYSHITKIATFEDSCAAKGYLKAFLEQSKPTAVGFK